MCNVNQVRLSVLQKAGIDDPGSPEGKYLINYYLSGNNIDKEPAGWDNKLADIQAKLDWNPAEQPFANLSAQPCPQMVLQASIAQAQIQLFTVVFLFFCTS
jgi:hypothetical protein